MENSRYVIGNLTHAPQILTLIFGSENVMSSGIGENLQNRCPAKSSFEEQAISCERILGMVIC